MDICRVRTSEEIKKAKELFREYADNIEIDLRFQNFEEELENLPGKYAPPDGELLLAISHGDAAGCAGIRKIDEEICELKRLYVRNEFRGKKIGKKLLTEILKTAIRIGYKSMRLDTMPNMEKAQQLYRSFGFKEIEPYVFNPIAGAKYMELDLTAMENYPRWLEAQKQ